MKQWLPTIFLVLLCAGGFWYVAANDFFVGEEETKGTHELVELTNEGLTDITIKTTNEAVKLTRKNEQWKLTDKPELQVNQSNVDGWINTVMLLVYSDIIEEKAKDLSMFGLDQPKATYSIERKGKKAIQIEVGNDLPTMDNRYVKVKGSDTVYKVNIADLDSLNKKESDFINPTIIPMNVPATTQLEVNWRQNSFVLKKTEPSNNAEDKNWTLNGKVKLKQTDAESILYELQQWSTSDATRSISEFDTRVPDLSVIVTEELNGQQKKREYIGMIGDERTWIAEKGTKWAYSILGDTIQTFVTKTNNKK